ncbi:Uncharacterized conserved protein YndB, AHSA1/START domain [Tangfeifania diversioriginum]|uniref:Uncharacterized conserved protein YndB, AHSA1/START domain n=1 Tax=Tangfeifania diversioriginum TaxID=1168035 RepID=A0A1M6DKF1_9BACT|nr:SRPBCC domain-containing protein [Tangfeifania diversioriginum]SHI73650.1 Uncharacterized conserved protein YndB, AHSA1/START domain [Tangfeifania diversioriginum]
MKRNLLFDFRVNKESNSLNITREFAANLELVWEAWTKPEILDQWWAPKPYHIKTKSLDFREGGMWLYAMISPENDMQWCKANYKKIELKNSLSWLDAFCDENGKENSDAPRSFWIIKFTEQNGITTVDVTLKLESLKEMESLIEMGFKEGFTMALENLDELLESK